PSGVLNRTVGHRPLAQGGSSSSNVTQRPASEATKRLVGGGTPKTGTMATVTSWLCAIPSRNSPARIARPLPVVAGETGVTRRAGALVTPGPALGVGVDHLEVGHSPAFDAHVLGHHPQPLGLYFANVRTCKRVGATEESTL